MIEPVAIYYEHCEPGWQVPRSRTNNQIAVLVTEGRAVFETEQGIFKLSRGDMLFMPEGLERSAVNSPEEAHEMYVAHFHYAGEGEGEGLPLVTAPEARVAKPHNYDYVRNRFAALVQYWLRQSPCRPALCHATLLELLALFAEASESAASQGAASGLVYRLEAYILLHYRRTITVGELAAHVGKTPNYVSALYRQSTGRTLTDYMQQIRIASACDLLLTSQMNIGEISDYLGFCEQSYFNKVFKKITGTLPSAYVRHKVDRSETDEDDD
ncbi:helix-turn-helix domain-containing protein [Cohnella sp. GCM10012308]|uniref:helix-turn-helix domain-containing protein n=1 Tax=Cohnella sp. GCM10012308 TaxID=3317329 RepID=UPI00362352DF